MCVFFKKVMPELLDIIGDNKSFIIHCDYGYSFTMTIDTLESEAIDKLRSYRDFLNSSNSLVHLDITNSVEILKTVILKCVLLNVN